MRTITFNKKQETRTCLFCKVNPVPAGRWDQRCSECKKKQREVKSVGVSLGSREPAAIIEVEGQEVFVDKFGKEVKNPGYDTKNDPQGWGHTGQVKKTKTVIL